MGGEVKEGVGCVCVAAAGRGGGGGGGGRAWGSKGSVGVSEEGV